MAPAQQLPQICFLWAPLNFADDVFHYIVFEDADGVPWSEGGAVLPVIGPRDDTVGPDVRFEHVARRPARHRLGAGAAAVPPGRAVRSAGRPAASEERIDLEPQLTFRMSGVGYSHPTWGHGRWHDELVVGGEALGRRPTSTTPSSTTSTCSR